MLPIDPPWLVSSLLVEFVNVLSCALLLVFNRILLNLFATYFISLRIEIGLGQLKSSVLLVKDWLLDTLTLSRT